MSSHRTVTRAFACLIACAVGAQAWAGPMRPATLKLGAPAYERNQAVEGEFQLALPVSGQATLTAELTDSLGRVLIRKSETVSINDGQKAVPVTLGAPNIVAMQHYLAVMVADAMGVTQYAQQPVVFMPPLGWHDYTVIMYQRHGPKRLPYLRAAGLDTMLWYGQSDATPEPFVEGNMRWYEENTATPVLAPYHRWDPELKVEHYFTVYKDRYKADRGNLELLDREPCLSNRITLETLRRMMMNPTRQRRMYRPMFYSLADEPGIGGQAAASDFCFAPACREKFRGWLKDRYGTIAALNAGWGTTYTDWKHVLPWTTDQQFARKGDNFSPWCDHTEFMDDTLMDAYRHGAETVKEFDPGAPVAIGGAQGPMAVGGWDFWKLSQVFDAMEPYYIANNYEMLRSFNPAMHLVSINGNADPVSQYRRWYLLVHGDHGAMLWDDNTDFVDDDGNYSARAKTCMPWLRELRGGLARQYMFAPRADDPVAIYHSQASMRVHWMLHVRPIGDAWIDRYSHQERVDNPYSRVRESWIKLVEDAGLQYTMLAEQQVRGGKLKAYDPATGEGFKLLVMPRIIALSADEVAAIRQFVANGGTVVADGQVGLFDEHGKRLPAGQLDDLFGVSRAADEPILEAGTVEVKLASPADSQSQWDLGTFKALEPNLKLASGDAMVKRPPAVVLKGTGQGGCVYLNLDLIDYHLWRLHPGEEAATRKMMNPFLLGAVGKDRRTPRVLHEGDLPLGVETTVKDLGQVRIVALMRNLQLRSSELGPQEYQSVEGLAQPIDVTVDARLIGQDKPLVYYDMRSGKRLGSGEQVKVTVPAYEAAMLSVWPAEPGAFTASVPERVTLGQQAAVTIKPGSALASEYVYRLEVRQPDGVVHEWYTTNVAVGGDGGDATIPLAANDPTGTWTVKVKEILTGATQEFTFELVD